MSNDYFNYTTELAANTLARSSAVNSRFTSVAVGFDLLPGKLKLQQNRVTYVSAGGTGDALTATLDFAPPAYVEGLHLRVKLTATNTGAATINVNSLGVKSIKRYDGTTALSAGELTSGNAVDLIYDGTNFRLGTASSAATAAAASAAAAAASASAASTSATNAANSATAAANSTTAAAGSATTASTQATNAATSATEAAASATAAAGSATTATTQATNASNSAAAAATSATNAATSATAAATAKTNAETAETNAETAETNAAASAASAAASAASINPSNLMHLTGVETATGVKSFSTAGTPVIVDSTDSTAKKIELRNNGAMVGALGSGASGAALMDSGGTARGTATTSGFGVTGPLSADSSVKSTSPTAGVGYGTGAGGTVTQATDKATAVTLNKVCGEITMNNAALAANTTVGFGLNNSALANGDVVLVQIKNGSVADASTYQVWSIAPIGSAASIYVRNISGGSLSEAIVIRFMVFKGVTA